MGMGLDHSIHCVHSCFVPKCAIGVVCCVNYIHGKMYIGKEEHWG